MHKGFAFPLVIVIVLLSVFAVCLFGINKFTRHKGSATGVEQENAELKQQVAENEKEIQALIADQAQITKTYEVPYSFREFGVWSPLFEDKQVSVTEYKYKRAVIRSKEIGLDGVYGTPGYTFINVWEFERRTIENDHEPQLKIFIGTFYNDKKPIPIQDFIDKNCDGEYKSKNSAPLDFCWKNRWMFNNVDLGSDLYSFQANSPTNNAMLIRISYLGGSISKTEHDLARKKMFTIADQVYTHQVK